MNGKMRSFIIGATLFLPLILFAFLKGCSTPVFHTLPKITDTVWSADKKQVQSFSYRQMPDFQLIDQNGNPFTLQNMKGHVWLVNFVSLNPQVDTMRKNVLIGNIKQEYYENAEIIDFVKVLTISTFPSQDKPEQMAAFAQAQKINTDKWIFATGTDAEVLKIMNTLHLPQVDTSVKSLAANFFSPNMYFVDIEGFVR
ncbi:MAG: SCO family protein, partial [Bacteroidia bacterium]